MRGKPTLECLDFQSLCRNTPQGFAVIQIAELRMTMRGVAIHVHESGRSRDAPPARPWVKDFCVITDEKGKAQYSPLFEFDNGTIRTAFSDAVIRAVLAYDAHTLEYREESAA